MVEPFSIASGIAGLITLCTAVRTAGYDYVKSVSSAPEDFKSFVRETASLSAVLSRLVSYSLSDQKVQQISALIQQDLLQDCEETLYNVQSLVRACELVRGSNRNNAVNTLLWPLKQKDIIKNRERLGRVCASLHTAISIESAATLRTLQLEQRRGNKVISELMWNVDEMKEQKVLDWLSTLDPRAKHTATTVLKQPGTYEWFLQEQTFIDWLNHGNLFWLHGASGVGKTVLI